ncbi:PadR family transcriptional regulator [Compostimonas suwonensis]|uniref:PadR family transcriptional regulator n=1 Tax=Compostimonas suwonensis TaxID=1048394 RepID=A0A2M9BZJ3_9MICO|nr:PadR family transcriptional regulator [Compostimonas suwonensis]PJJ63503.1 PadR family transcriptional regulator [Compostimonas suwonensis]
MQPLSRITPATVDVLRCLLDGGDADGAVWGLQIVKASSRPPGSVYPILERLERSGWVHSAWERDEGRPGPRRRLYELTGQGVEAAREVVSAFDARRAASVVRGTGVTA